MYSTSELETLMKSHSSLLVKKLIQKEITFSLGEVILTLSKVYFIYNKLGRKTNNTVTFIQF